MSIFTCLESLCSLIKSLTSEDVTIQDFRLAKANTGNVPTNIRFWKVLHAFLRTGEGACKRDHTTISEFVNCTKFMSSAEGYKRVQLYCLPEDCLTGSRELLVEFCWIICNDGIETIIDEKLCTNTHPENYRMFSSSGVEQAILHASLDPIRQLNCILHRSGKLKHYMRFIEQLITEKQHVVDKVKKVMNIKHSVPLLQSLTDNTGDAIEHLHKFYHVLEMYMNWAENSKTFFEWMESVLIDIMKESSPIDLSKTDLDEVLSDADINEVVFALNENYDSGDKKSDSSCCDEAGAAALQVDNVSSKNDSVINNIEKELKRLRRQLEDIHFVDDKREE